MKTVAIATVVLLAATLTACGGADKTAKDATSTPVVTTSDSTATTATTPTTSDTSTATSPTTTVPTTPTSSDTSDPTGTNEGSAYCAELRSAKSQFDNLNITGLDDKHFTQLTTEFDALASSAPSAVQNDWRTLSTALTKVQQILASAGLSFDDLQTLSAGHRPPGVSVKQLEKVGRELTKFSSDKSFGAAANEISADAKAECGITLGN